MAKVKPHTAMQANPRYELRKVTGVHRTLNHLTLSQLQTQREDPLEKDYRRGVPPLGAGPETQHMRPGVDPPSASLSFQLCDAWVKNSLLRAELLRRAMPSGPTCRDRGHQSEGMWGVT